MTVLQTTDLAGAALDWAVAKALGCELMSSHDHFRRVAALSWDEDKIAAHLAKQVDSQVIVNPFTGNSEPIPNYSGSWSATGPIIERELITLDRFGGAWLARKWNSNHEPQCATGETLLVAAMRCFVVARLGWTIEVPG
ncbi:DUF2591 domain-containing protein (plasmid) [Cupriavidus pinatubonensis]|uniref:phage protein NinX family protein n=1 Tax=Cupriavidus pinatubonensis TaxID=248026 RepID=UPI001C72E6E6|nr:phage protein NinX family protein [Cupriavidus pinatubonensis]QYY33673.1 DUF2591 domain-containing protein [Cupriavidus pinatubonensis]